MLAAGDRVLAPAAGRTVRRQARWPEGPVCDTCYTAALRRRARCAALRPGAAAWSSRQARTPSPAPDCAGLPVMSACAGCGTEDKLYDKGRCGRCSLRQARHDSACRAGNGDVPATLQRRARGDLRGPQSAHPR